MGNRYTDELAAWASTKAEAKRRQDTAAVAFLAVKADVIEAMEAGYALTTIYDHMHETGRVKASYETFRRHVQRFIKAAPAATRSASSSPPATVPAVTPKPVAPAQTNPTGEQTGKIPRFNFNPTPNKEDLL